MKSLIMKLGLQGKTSVSVLIVLVSLGVFGAYLIFVYSALKHEIKTINLAWTELRALNKHETELVRNLTGMIKSSASESGAFEHISIDDVTDAEYKCSVIELSDDLIDNQHDFSQYQQAYMVLEVALDALLVGIKQYSSLQYTSSQDISLQGASSQDTSLQTHSLVAQQYILLRQIELNRQQLLIAREKYNRLVLAYNNNIDRFPQNVLVRILGLMPKAYFVVDDALLQF